MRARGADLQPLHSRGVRGHKGNIPPLESPCLLRRCGWGRPTLSGPSVGDSAPAWPSPQPEEGGRGEERRMVQLSVPGCPP